MFVWLHDQNIKSMREALPVRVYKRNMVQATPMLLASARGELHVCQHLLKHGARDDVRSKCNFRRSCLSYACQGVCRLCAVKKGRLYFWHFTNDCLVGGHFQVAKLLVTQGAKEDIRARCQLGCTALFLACSAGNLQVAKWLCTEGAQQDIFTRDASGHCRGLSWTIASTCNCVFHLILFFNHSYIFSASACCVYQWSHARSTTAPASRSHQWRWTRWL